MVSNKVFVISLLIAIIASSAVTSVFFLSQAPMITPSGEHLVNVTDYIAGLSEEDAPVYAPIVEGYYQQNGIVATPAMITAGTTAAVEALAADRTGYAFVVYGSIFNIVAFEAQNPNGTKLVSVASNGNTNPIGVVYLTSSGISKPSDLVGKTVGAPSGGLSVLMFDAFLNKEGLEGKVNIENVGFAQLAPALFTKKIDGIVQYTANVPAEAIEAKAFNETLSYLSLSDYGMPPVGFGILVQQSLVDNHPEVVRAIVNATMTGIRFCILDLRGCIADLIKEQPQFDFNIALSENQAFFDTAMGVPFNDTSKVQNLTALQLGWQDPATMSQVVQLAEQIYNISGIAPNSVYTNQFVEQP